MNDDEWQECFSSILRKTQHNLISNEYAQSVDRSRRYHNNYVFPNNINSASSGYHQNGVNNSARDRGMPSNYSNNVASGVNQPVPMTASSPISHNIEEELEIAQYRGHLQALRNEFAKFKDEVKFELENRTAFSNQLAKKIKETVMIELGTSEVKLRGELKQSHKDIIGKLEGKRLILPYQPLTNPNTILTILISDFETARGYSEKKIDEAMQQIKAMEKRQSKEHSTISDSLSEVNIKIDQIERNEIRFRKELESKIENQGSMWLHRMESEFVRHKMEQKELQDLVMAMKNENEGKLAEIRNNIATQERLHEILNNHFNEISLKFKTTKQKLDQQDDILLEVRNRVLQHDSSNNALESKIQVLQQRDTDLSEAVNSLREQLNEASKNKMKANDELKKAIESQFSDLATKEEKHRNKLASDLEAVGTKCDKLVDELREVKKVITAESEQLNKLATELERIERILKELTKRIDDNDERLDRAAKTQTISITQLSEETKTTIAAVERRIKETQGPEIDTIKQRIERIEGEIKPIAATMLKDLEAKINESEQRITALFNDFQQQQQKQKSDNLNPQEVEKRFATLQKRTEELLKLHAQTSENILSTTAKRIDDMVSVAFEEGIQERITTANEKLERYFKESINTKCQQISAEILAQVELFEAGIKRDVSLLRQQLEEVQATVSAPLTPRKHLYSPRKFAIPEAPPGDGSRPHSPRSPRAFAAARTIFAELESQRIEEELSPLNRQRSSTPLTPQNSEVPTPTTIPHATEGLTADVASVNAEEDDQQTQQQQQQQQEQQQDEANPTYERQEEKEHDESDKQQVELTIIEENEQIHAPQPVETEIETEYEKPHEQVADAKIEADSSDDSIPDEESGSSPVNNSGHVQANDRDAPQRQEEEEEDQEAPSRPPTLGIVSPSSVKSEQHNVSYESNWDEEDTEESIPESDDQDIATFLGKVATPRSNKVEEHFSNDDLAEKPVPPATEEQQAQTPSPNDELVDHEEHAEMEQPQPTNRHETPARILADLHHDNESVSSAYNAGGATYDDDIAALLGNPSPQRGGPTEQENQNNALQSEEKGNGEAAEDVPPVMPAMDASMDVSTISTVSSSYEDGNNDSTADADDGVTFEAARPTIAEHEDELAQEAEDSFASNHEEDTEADNNDQVDAKQEAEDISTAMPAEDDDNIQSGTNNIAEDEEVSSGNNDDEVLQSSDNDDGDDDDALLEKLMSTASRSVAPPPLTALPPASEGAEHSPTEDEPSSPSNTASLLPPAPLPADEEDANDPPPPLPPLPSVPATVAAEDNNTNETPTNATSTPIQPNSSRGAASSSSSSILDVIDQDSDDDDDDSEEEEEEEAEEVKEEGNSSSTPLPPLPPLPSSDAAPPPPLPPLPAVVSSNASAMKPTAAAAASEFGSDSDSGSEEEEEPPAPKPSSTYASATISGRPLSARQPMRISSLLSATTKATSKPVASKTVAPAAMSSSSSLQQRRLGQRPKLSQTLGIGFGNHDDEEFDDNMEDNNSDNDGSDDFDDENEDTGRTKPFISAAVAAKRQLTSAAGAAMRPSILSSGSSRTMLQQDEDDDSDDDDEWDDEGTNLPM